MGIGAGDDDDDVLPRLVDGDHRVPAGTGDGLEPGVDPQPPQARCIAATRIVVPDGADHDHLGTCLAGRDGLVGTLAAGEPLEAFTEEGLAGLGKPFDVGDQVDVQ